MKQKFISKIKNLLSSMLPKIEACLDFLDNNQKIAMITSLKDAIYLDKKNIGTKIIKGGEKNE